MSTIKDPEVQQLINDLRYLRDRLAIVDCINRYGRGLDRR